MKTESGIRFLDFSFPGPEENLALEELLLMPFRKNPGLQAILRIWENRTPVVVLGRGDSAQERVDLVRTRELRVPVIRRVSGGGPVVHGPGNLNISFFLPFCLHPELSGLRPSYSLVIGWVREAVFRVSGVRPDLMGDSDLAIKGRKISGNAQARKRYGMLHHLTLLVDFDIASAASLLLAPGKAPEYRGGRSHAEFLTTLRREGVVFDRGAFASALLSAFGAHENMDLGSRLVDAAKSLAKHKYMSEEWNLRGRSPAEDAEAGTGDAG